jgi:ornithine cyclodeaminase/alanine dehydrogenase-like protein (mu-crystallin family)
VRLICLSETDVAAVLTMRDTIAAVESALRAQAAGQVDQPLRVMARAPNGILGAMPAAIAGVGLGAKLVSFFPENAALGIHTHTAVIALVDPDNGIPLALIDGRLITEMRTAATSAVATRALALEGATVAMLGTGVQARSHTEALREVGMLEALRIWGRTRAHADLLAGWARSQGIRATTAATAADACRGANVICTVTSARQAILDSDDVADGSHINAVGASTAQMQELTPALVARARLVVDTVEGAMNEAGEVIAAVRTGALPAKPDMVRLCDVVAGKAAGRRSPADVTLFKSLGMAIEDVACAALVYERARERGLGSAVEM